MGKTKSFEEFCTLCEKEAVTAGRTGAATNYRKTRQKVKHYLSGATLWLTELDSEWIKGFDEWLERQGRSKSTISFYNRNIRAIYNQAAGKQLVRNRHPFDEAYTKPPVARFRLSLEDGEEDIHFESLSRDELLRRYKSLAYKYNNIVHRLREIMPV